MTSSDQTLSVALRFIDEHIASPEELELLIAIVGMPTRWWDSAHVSYDLGIPVGSARRMLERFAAANLLDIRLTGDVRYQFRPGTQQLHDGALAVAAAYRTQPTALLQRFARFSDFGNSHRKA